jgi:hypothetical protein
MERRETHERGRERRRNRKKKGVLENLEPIKREQ